MTIHTTQAADNVLYVVIMLLMWEKNDYFWQNNCLNKTKDSFKVLMADCSLLSVVVY